MLLHIKFYKTSGVAIEGAQLNLMLIGESFCYFWKNFSLKLGSIRRIRLYFLLIMARRFKII